MKVGVIGAGTMGQGIAKAFAQVEGNTVALCDIKQEWADNGKAKIAAGYAKLVAKVNRLPYKDVIDDLDLGSVIYPKYITSDSILRYVRAMQNTIGSNVETLYHVLDNQAEALEFIIRDTLSCRYSACRAEPQEQSSGLLSSPAVLSVFHEARIRFRSGIMLSS